MTGGFRARSVIAAAGVVVLAGSMTHADARTGAAPTLRLETTVQGEAVPATLASGAWSFDAGRWSVTLQSTAPPAGETSAQSTWRSPIFSVRPKQVFFATSIATEHQGQSDRTIRFEERARVCYVGGGCERRWFGDAADQMPQAYTDALPFVVSSEQGMSFQWGTEPSGPLYIEWRFRFVQSGVDEQTTTVAVAAGKAAKRLSDEMDG